jgi:hypothetical protein
MGERPEDGGDVLSAPGRQGGISGPARRHHEVEYDADGEPPNMIRSGAAVKTSSDGK